MEKSVGRRSENDNDGRSGRNRERRLFHSL